MCYIFQIIENPNEKWAEAEDLLECFYKNNPFWTNEGLPLDTEDEDRQYFIDELADELPNGYSIENETISISMGYKDFPETFKHHIQDICNTVMSWVRKKTKDYNKSFKEWELPDTRYIAEKLGSAGVPYQTAYDFVKKNYPDVKQEDFDAGYYQDFDQEFREDILRHLNLL